MQTPSAPAYQPLYSDISALEGFNTGFEQAIKGVDKSALTALFREAVANPESSTLVKSLQKHGSFRSGLKFEANIELLIKQFLGVEIEINAKIQTKNVMLSDLDTLKKFSENMGKLFQLVHAKGTEVNQSPSLRMKMQQMKKVESKEFSQAIKNLEILKQKALAAIEKPSISTRLTSHRAVLKEALHITIPYRLQEDVDVQKFLKKKGAETSKQIDIYLEKFSKIEKKRPVSLLGHIKSFARREETAFGEKNVGSLARGVYSGIYNRIVDAKNALLESTTLKSFVRNAQKLGESVIEAKTLEAAMQSKNTPEVKQAKCALALMNLRTFVQKTELNLRFHGKLNEESAEQLNYLYAKLGVNVRGCFSEERLKSITLDELNELAKAVFETIEKNKWNTTSWRAVQIEDRINSTITLMKPYTELADELMDSLVKLEDQ
ncbi:MAG: hypothetical protein JWO53_767 [Chlamydiia bacterium]|nr:hypothetical protein [Chlamydiia bacterium]